MPVRKVLFAFFLISNCTVFSSNGCVVNAKLDSSVNCTDNQSLLSSNNNDFPTSSLLTRSGNELSVKLVEFSVKEAESAGVKLAWSTASESGDAHFVIERSADGERFERIAKVLLKGSNSFYNYLDSEFHSGLNCYRLSLYDAEGRSTVLGTQKINVSLNSNLAELYPNPIKTNVFQVKLKSISKEARRIEVLGFSAELIASCYVLPKNGVLNIVLPFKPSAGIYLVKIDGESPLKLVVE